MGGNYIYEIICTISQRPSVLHMLMHKDMLVFFAKTEERGSAASPGFIIRL